MNAISDVSLNQLTPQSLSDLSSPSHALLSPSVLQSCSICGFFCFILIWLFIPRRIQNHTGACVSVCVFAGGLGLCLSSGLCWCIWKELRIIALQRCLAEHCCFSLILQKSSVFYIGCKGIFSHFQSLFSGIKTLLSTCLQMHEQKCINVY